jgi:hypothetical protein
MIVDAKLIVQRQQYRHKALDQATSIVCGVSVHEFQRSMVEQNKPER